METWDLINRRGEQKQQILNAKRLDEKRTVNKVYMQINKQVKRSVRKNKRNWMENLAKRAQTAAKRNNPRELYTITRILVNKNSVRNYPVRNKNE